jgi:TctA family transporter
VWVKLLSIPYRLLYPAIMMFMAIGVYSVNNAHLDIYLTAIFGLLGYLFVKLDCQPAPLILAFVLGPLMEENLRRALLISRGDPTVFITRPISATFLVVTALLITIMVIPSVRKKRDEATAEPAEA